jgi:hypothetical protein
MKVRLPYSKTRRYLRGMDWIVGTLDHMSRRQTGGSNDSQIVLELAGPFDDAQFRSAVDDFVRLFPVLGGRPARDWNLAPYWKMPPRERTIPVSVEVAVTAERDLSAALERSVNTRFAKPTEHLAFRVFHAGESSHFLAVHFDHRIFDAEGAEAFLDLLQRWHKGEDCRARLAEIQLAEPAHLSEWQRKFEAGKQLVRLLLSFSKTTLRVLPRPSPLRGRGFRFKVIAFDEAATRAVTERAYREAGFLMFMPYALASAIQVLDATFKARSVPGQDYLVSVSVGLRTPKTAGARLFFNHLSFLFFHIPSAMAGDRNQVLAAIRAQMYEQVKAAFPAALDEASMLMRILPHGMLSRILLRPRRGEVASFGFSCVGRGGYTHRDFMGAGVMNLIHMPMVPIPPGVGFVVNQFGPRMNAVLSYVDGLLSDEEAQRIEDGVRRVF